MFLVPQRYSISHLKITGFLVLRRLNCLNVHPKRQTKLTATRHLIDPGDLQSLKGLIVEPSQQFKQIISKRVNIVDIEAL